MDGPALDRADGTRPGSSLGAERQSRVAAYLDDQPDITFALLFGSHGRGTPHADSDIDIAVMLAPESATTPRERVMRRAALAADLAGILGTDDVDVAIVEDAPLPLRFRIFRDGVLLSCRDRRAFVATKARTLSEYFDFAPSEAMYNRIILRRAAEGTLSHGPDRDPGALERYRRLRARLAADSGREPG